VNCWNLKINLIKAAFLILLTQTYAQNLDSPSNKISELPLTVFCEEPILYEIIRFSKSDYKEAQISFELFPQLFSLFGTNIQNQVKYFKNNSSAQFTISNYKITTIESANEWVTSISNTNSNQTINCSQERMKRLASNFKNIPIGLFFNKDIPPIDAWKARLEQHKIFLNSIPPPYIFCYFLIFSYC
jgi:hypothetical protein